MSRRDLVLWVGPCFSSILFTGGSRKYRRSVTCWHGIPKDKRLVVYCTIGYRSGKYAMELAKQGIKAENLEGGVLAWTFVGGKFLVKDAKGEWMETNRVHVYDPEWNIVHPDYVGVVQ